MWGWGCQRKIARPRQGPPTSPAPLYKGGGGAQLGGGYSRHTKEFSLLRKPCNFGSLLQEHLSLWIILTVRSPARMKLVHVALLYLGSVTFFGVDAARVDVATEFKRKWTKWALSRAKRDVKPSGALRGLGAAANVQLLIRTQDVKEDPRVSHPSSREDAHIRVKRYRQSINSFPHFQAIRTGCRFGTCTVQKLAHDIFQLTDKDKDDAAPASKISPQGYGRRRRSLPEPRSPARFLWAGRRSRTRRPFAPVLGV
ncbi:pro-adrenomedullin [Falco naumanni]|uniref:pro-adrenomedullin n=1 Tax=Falco naumanni TaxID=148594 RepID=UPI001ADE0A55|nr:pro-adrenomedullin [Falco naumanni]